MLFSRRCACALPFGSLFFACVGDEPASVVEPPPTSLLDASIDEGGSIDAGIDEGCTKTTTSSFGVPVLVPGLPADGVATPSLTDGELEIIFADDGDFVSDAGTLGPSHLVRATRTSKTAAFGAQAPLAQFLVGEDQRAAALTPSGLGIYFQVLIDGGSGLWTSTRSSTQAAFASPVPVNALNSARVGSPYVSWAGDALYFVRGETVYHLFRAESANGFNAAAAIPELDTPFGENTPVATADDLTLYYARHTAEDDQIWLARRASKTLPYTEFRVVSELNRGAINLPSWVSRDGCRLYFTSNASGALRLYYADKVR